MKNNIQIPKGYKPYKTIEGKFAAHIGPYYIKYKYPRTIFIVFIDNKLSNKKLFVKVRPGIPDGFRLDINELRPLGRTARGVKSMNLREGDNLVSMDVLTSNLVDQLAKIEDLAEDLDDNVEENSSDGPWVLIASAFGLGKRVPVAQFRLQKRAGMGLRAIKFRIKDDQLVCLKVLGEGEELLLVTEKGVIVRTNADKISQQSRAATGVKLQRLDDGDHLSEVVLVPREQIEGKDQPSSVEQN